jgi:hypothetical protein
LSKVEGVDKIMLSGMTAFVTLNGEEAKLMKGDVRKAFDEAGLKLEKMNQREIAKPAESYLIAVTGGT